MNPFNIARAFQQKKERGWETIYVAIDLHGTLIRPYHSTIEFYPYAVEVIKWFNSRPDFKLILWTSTHFKETMDFLDALRANGIKFDSINKNRFEKSSARANFEEKFYFNILIEDKAGFEPDTDWELIKNELQRLGEWERKFDK